MFFSRIKSEQSLRSVDKASLSIPLRMPDSFARPPSIWKNKQAV